MCAECDGEKKKTGSGWGCLGASPQKNLRYPALKSAFWWILEMVLLWIMEKVKDPKPDRGFGPPDPSPGSATEKR